MNTQPNEAPTERDAETAEAETQKLSRQKFGRFDDLFDWCDLPAEAAA